MFAEAKLVDTVDRVKPDRPRPRQRETSIAESTYRNLRHRAEATRTWDLNCPTARCGPACRVVWEGADQR